jgi:hypothetical protein
MQIEAGGTYRTESGHRVGPMILVQDKFIHKFGDKVSWDQSGKVHIYGGRRPKYARDITSTWKEPDINPTSAGGPPNPQKVKDKGNRRDLRDDVALAVLSSCRLGESEVKDWPDDLLRDVCLQSYRIADAMMAAREVRS